MVTSAFPSILFVWTHAISDPPSAFLEFFIHSLPLAVYVLPFPPLLSMNETSRQVTRSPFFDLLLEGCCALSIERPDLSSLPIEHGQGCLFFLCPASAGRSCHLLLPCCFDCWCHFPFFHMSLASLYCAVVFFFFYRSFRVFVFPGLDDFSHLTRAVLSLSKKSTHPSYSQAQAHFHAIFYPFSSPRGRFHSKLRRGRIIVRPRRFRPLLSEN